MPDEQLITCPACGVPVPRVAFCDLCGADLAGSTTPREVAQPAAPSRVEPSVSSDDTTVEQERDSAPVFSPPPPDRREMRAEPQVLRSPTVSAGASGPAQAQAEREPSSAVFSNEPLALDIDEMRVFITGIRSSFAFRLVPLMADAHQAYDFRVALRIDGKDPLDEQRMRMPREGLWNISFRGDEPGMNIPVRIELSYHIDGRPYRFEGDFVFDCYPPDENPGKIIENLEVKVSDITAREAGDAPISVRVLDNFIGHSADSLNQQMKQMKVPSAWRRIPLYRCFGGDVEQALLDGLPRLKTPPPATDRLTLHSLRRRIHLMGGNTITLGRFSDMDIMCRVYKSNGELDRDRSAEVSKAHATIQIEPGRIWLADGGFDPVEKKPAQSGAGTYLNDRRIPYGSPVELPLDKPFTIRMASFHLKGRVFTCNALGGRHACVNCMGTTRPASLVLERTDSRPDIYCIVCCMMNLGQLDPTFSRELVFRKSNAFAAVAPRGFRMDAAWLTAQEPRSPVLPAGWTVGAFELSDPTSQKNVR